MDLFVHFAPFNQGWEGSFDQLPIWFFTHLTTSVYIYIYKHMYSDSRTSFFISWIQSIFGTLSPSTGKWYPLTPQKADQNNSSSTYWLRWWIISWNPGWIWTGKFHTGRFQNPYNTRYCNPISIIHNPMYIRLTQPWVFFSWLPCMFPLLPKKLLKDLETSIGAWSFSRTISCSIICFTCWDVCFNFLGPKEQIHRIVEAWYVVISTVICMNMYLKHKIDII